MRGNRLTFRDFLQQAEALVLVFAVFALVGLSVILVAFVAVDLHFTAGSKPPELADFVTRSCLRLLGLCPDKLSGELYAAGVSMVLSRMVATVTIWFAVVPVLAYRRHKRAIREAVVVDVTKVRTVGRDDLRTMHRYYKNAAHITIFSGDFDFVLKHDELRKLLIELAVSRKLLLVSYRRRKEIEDSWNRQAQELNLSTDVANTTLNALRASFRFHERRFKFSLIDYGQGQASFLSLVPGRSPDDCRANLGVHGGKNPHAAALVHIVRNLCDIENCESLEGWNGGER